MKYNAVAVFFMMVLAMSAGPCAADSQQWMAIIMRHQPAYNSCVDEGFVKRECRIEREIMSQALQHYREDLAREGIAAGQRAIIEQNQAILRQLEENQSDIRRQQERRPSHVYSPSAGGYVACWGEVDCRHQSR